MTKRAEADRAPDDNGRLCEITQQTINTWNAEKCAKELGAAQERAQSILQELGAPDLRDNTRGILEANLQILSRIISGIKLRMYVLEAGVSAKSSRPQLRRVGGTALRQTAS